MIQSLRHSPVTAPTGGSMTFFRTLLALALLSPALSFANSIDMTTLGGTLSIANSNLLVLHGSELTSINVNGKLFTGDLGTIDLVKSLPLTLIEVSSEPCSTSRLELAMLSVPPKVVM